MVLSRVVDGEREVEPLLLRVVALQMDRGRLAAQDLERAGGRPAVFEPSTDLVCWSASEGHDPILPWRDDGAGGRERDVVVTDAELARHSLLDRRARCEVCHTRRPPARFVVRTNERPPHGAGLPSRAQPAAVRAVA